MPLKNPNLPIETEAKQRMRRVMNHHVAGDNMKTSMAKEGYSKSYQRMPQSLRRTETWQELLREVDDSVVMDRIYEILQDEDKRSSLTAADMILKLKDKYPANKSKIMNYDMEMGELFEENKTSKVEKE